MTNFFCDLSAFPLRSEPRHGAELVTELLFGEIFTVIEKQGTWLKVKVQHDSYTGWLERKDPLFEFEGEIQDLEIIFEKTVCESPLGNIKLHPGSFWHSSFEDKGYFIHNSSRQNNISTDLWKALIEKQKETPYFWGGKRSDGYDCSGFVQVFYRCLGIMLPRDASQQIDAAEKKVELNQAQFGDLAFFENEKGRITHIGILLNSADIIHVSEKVRIDELRDAGIYRKCISEITHKLHSVRRLQAFEKLGQI